MITNQCLLVKGNVTKEIINKIISVFSESVILEYELYNLIGCQLTYFAGKTRAKKCDVSSAIL
jgi:hypothetical protein